MRERIALYVKTRYFYGDRRVEREIESLHAEEFDVDLYVATDDDVQETPKFACSFSALWVPGGAAPANMALRMLGALVFSLQAVFLAVFKQPKTRYQWVSDPILFPLVILLKLLTNKKVVWDHHELPPDWISEVVLLRRLFAFAYRKADIVVHTNAERRAYLEEKLNCQAKQSWLLPNYPREQDMVSGKCPEQALGHTDFIYLQNTIGENRCDVEVFGAIKRSGMQVVYAGHVKQKRYELLQEKLDIDSFCTFVGHLSLAEINCLLERCALTLIFYKNRSTNNWLCEPNRLYQAMNKQARIVTGNNPVFLNYMQSYPFGVAAATDGSDEEAIYIAIQKARGLAEPSEDDSNAGQSFFWEEGDSVFRHIRDD